MWFTKKKMPVYDKRSTLILFVPVGACMYEHILCECVHFTQAFILKVIIGIKCSSCIWLHLYSV